MALEEGEEERFGVGFTPEELDPFESVDVILCIKRLTDRRLFEGDALLVLVNLVEVLFLELEDEEGGCKLELSEGELCTE